MCRFLWLVRVYCNGKQEGAKENIICSQEILEELTYTIFSYVLGLGPNSQWKIERIQRRNKGETFPLFLLNFALA